MTNLDEHVENNNSKENYENLVYGPNRKEIEILNFFKNGDKTKLDYMNSINQEFDANLFDVLFVKNYLAFKDGTKYNDLSSGEKYIFRQEINDNKVIYTTSDGDKYLENKIKKQTLNIVSTMPIFNMVNNIIKPYKDMSNMFRIFNNDLLNQLKPVKDALEVYKSSNITNQLFESRKQISQLLNISNISSNDLKAISSQLRDLKPAIEQLKNMSVIGFYKDLPNLNIKINQKEDLKQAKNMLDNLGDAFDSIDNALAYRYIFIIENYLRNKIYFVFNLDEDNDFCKYNQFNNCLTSNYGQILSIIDKIKTEYDDEQHGQLLKDIKNKFIADKKNRLDLIKKSYYKESKDKSINNQNVRLIDFFDFGDLINILKNKQKSEIILSLCPQNNVSEYVFYLNQISKIRNKIAHNRKIYSDELNMLNIFHNFLQRIERDDLNV